jgi:hypothetical protein
MVQLKQSDSRTAENTKKEYEIFKKNYCFIQAILRLFSTKWPELANHPVALINNQQ